MVTVRRATTARRILGRKVVNGKEYRYVYYTLPLNLYLPKSMVEKWGTEFIIERDEDSGKITIISKKALNGFSNEA